MERWRLVADGGQHCGGGNPLWKPEGGREEISRAKEGSEGSEGSGGGGKERGKADDDDATV